MNSYAKINNIEDNKLSNMFFSENNIIHLQKELKNVLMKYGYKTTEQSPDIINSYMYVCYERDGILCNKNEDIRNLLNYLNKKVVSEMAMRMIAEIKENQIYQEDFNKIPVPLLYPEYMSKNKTLENTQTFI
tara:strand:+ start:67 stop:462 length:396 start_codon:yes stop_codon:yes gene_type:complete